MKFKSFSKLVSALGNLGVLVGLVLVAIELNQTNDLMAAQDRWNRFSALTSNQALYIENADMVSIFNKVEFGEELTPGEQLALDLIQRNAMRLREWTFRELPKEELPIEQWERAFSSDMTRNFWIREKHEYESEFAEFIDNVLLSD